MNKAVKTMHNKTQPQRPTSQILKTALAKSLKYVADKLEVTAREMEAKAIRRKADEAKKAKQKLQKGEARGFWKIWRGDSRKTERTRITGKDEHLIPVKGQNGLEAKKQSGKLEKAYRHDNDIAMQQTQQRIKSAMSKRKAISTFPRSR